jgi:transcription elongation GreA/GreB family factor
MRKNVPLLLEALLVLDNLGDDQARTEAEDLIQGSADPTGTVLAIRSADLRREGMIILEGRGDPAAVRKDLFLRSGNAADWEALNRRMNTAERTELGWEVHRGLPERAAAYFWMVRKTEEGFPLPGAPLDRAIRLVGLLDESSGLVGPVTSFIAEGRVLQRAVEDSREKAETLLRFVSEARLPVSLKEEILTDVYARFPVLRPSHELIFTTPAGLGTKEDELRQLVKVELPQNKAAIAEAKAHGDLRENFEYKAAKEQQDRILARIDEIQAELSRVRMLNPETVDTSAVSPGCMVTLVGKDDETARIVILGPWESDPDVGVFSYRAPAIRPLLGRRPGDVVALDLPQASGSFRIGTIAPWCSPA